MHVVLDEGVVSLSSHPHGFRTVEGGATNRGAKMLAPSSELSVATLGSPVIEVSVDRNAFFAASDTKITVKGRGLCGHRASLASLVFPKISHDR